MIFSTFLFYNCSIFSCVFWRVTWVFCARLCIHCEGRSISQITATLTLVITKRNMLQTYTHTTYARERFATRISSKNMRRYSKCKKWKKKQSIHDVGVFFFHRVSVCNVALWYGNKTSIISHILADGDECLQVRLCNVPCMMHICNGTWCWLAVLWVSFCHYLKQTTYGRCGHRTNVRDGREWSKKKQRNKMSEMATPEK